MLFSFRVDFSRSIRPTSPHALPTTFLTPFVFHLLHRLVTCRPFSVKLSPSGTGCLLLSSLLRLSLPFDQQFDATLSLICSPMVYLSFFFSHSFGRLPHFYLYFFFFLCSNTFVVPCFFLCVVILLLLLLLLYSTPPSSQKEAIVKGGGGGGGREAISFPRGKAPD